MASITLIQDVFVIDMGNFPKMTYLTDKSLRQFRKAASKYEKFLCLMGLYVTAGIFVFFWRRAIRANVRAQKSLFGEIGIDRDYPMLNLPAQCKSLEANLGMELFKVIDNAIDKKITPKRASLDRMKEAAQRTRTKGIAVRPCRWIEDTIDEIDDDLIAPLLDIRTTLSSLYGPEAAKIEKLNKKIKTLLA